MHPGRAPLAHGIGLAITLLCLIGLVVAWPYLEALIAGTWLSDLRLVVLAVFVAVALSAMHALEVRVSARFGHPDRSQDGE